MGRFIFHVLALAAGGFAVVVYEKYVSTKYTRNNTSSASSPAGFHVRNVTWPVNDRLGKKATY